MNKHSKNLLRALRLCLLVSTSILIAASTQAQRLGAANNSHSEANSALALPRLKLSIIPAGLRLMPPINVSTNAGSRSNTVNLMPMATGPNLQVLGGGTLGRLTKWSGFTSSNSFIGDTTIFESREGLVGIGTDSPTSKLTVAGMIQTALGGLKFPDGTVQTTAAFRLHSHWTARRESVVFLREVDLEGTIL